MVDKGRCQRLVGKLIYLSHIRLNIAFAISVVSQYMHSPCQTHFDFVYRILRYFKKTQMKGLFFGKEGNKKMKIFTDVDQTRSVNDKKSTFEYYTCLQGNLVTWCNKKQSIVANNSVEVEYKVMAQCIGEAIWLKRLLEELKIGCEFSMQFYCDNTVTINIAHNLVHHDRTKHVEVDKHFIIEKL